MAGTERYLTDLLKYASKNVEVAVICQGSGPLGESLKASGIPVTELSFQNKKLPETAFQIYAYLRKWKPDAVHTHLGRATLVGAIAARLARVRVVVTTLHFIKPAYASTHPRMLYPFFLLGHKLVNLCLTRMITISQAVGNETIRRERVAPAKLIYIPHGTAFQARSLSQLERCQAREALHIAAQAPVVITVARLESEKGYHRLLSALPLILKNQPNVQFLWVGDALLRQELEEAVWRSGLHEHVHFLGFQNDLARLLALSDLFLHPTAIEGFGIAVLEAMAAGLPVVAINAGGPAEIVVNYETGRLVEDDPDALARVVCELLADPVMARAMGRAGRQRCLSYYSVERMVNQTEQLYFELLHAKA
jgi:glycosyltransferase involved in cell wall biosynthesis